MGDFLRCLVGEKASDSDLILPTAEFAYNNSINWLISKIPFSWLFSLHPIDLVPYPLKPKFLSLLKILLLTHL